MNLRICFCILFLLVSASLKAQYVWSPNTYFLIPPTSGCNGIWAVEPPADTCVAPYMIQMIPQGCLTYNRSAIDTIFYNLCSIPCNYSIIGGDAQVCTFCSVGPVVAGINESAISDELLIFPNPSSDKINIRTENFTENEFTFLLYNLHGQIVKRKFCYKNNENETIELNGIENGLYFWKLIFSHSEKTGKLNVIN